ncbi:hypothetical protein [Brevibacterium sp. 50QC2O2]|uniref:arsenate reductase/protein-tyrosine-phosphatase family protein n=1 Tax=Brevibacterium sp. 50QC2O2 TaxID=2968459 RepID=UPI00359304CA
MQSHLDRKAPAPANSNLNILFICTGNICRSAYAHHALDLELEQMGHQRSITVASAGTHAVVGSPMDPTMETLFTHTYGNGLPPEHIARQVTETALRSADLIFCMTNAHMEQLSTFGRRVYDHTFLLPEIQNTLAASEPNTVLGRQLPPEIPDPFRHDTHIYKTVARQITSHIGSLRYLITRISQETHRQSPPVHSQTESYQEAPNLDSIPTIIQSHQIVQIIQNNL